MDKPRGTNSNITVGVKLDMGFSTDRFYRELFGDRDIPEYLAQLGFEGVETPVGPQTDPTALKDHAARCRDAGLKISLHPYSERTDSNPACFSTAEDNACKSFHQRFLSLAAEISSVQRAPTIVNIHAAAGPAEDSRPDLIDRSVHFFSWARHWCRRNAQQVRPVVELQISPNPGERIQRIGDTYDEVLEVATQSGVKACWDFGHAYLNHTRYGVPLYPPIDLLRHIGHVHCHDARGDDHHALVYGTIPWREFVRLLIDHGFDGSIILEVPSWNFLDAGGIRSLAESLDALKAQIL